MFDNFATKEIECILRECAERQGWELPQTLIRYATGILADKINKNPWQPEPSYAEAYLNTKDAAALVALGDTCWFTRAVFPESRQRRGIPASYYVDLGTGCYARARMTVRVPVLALMEQHFEFLAEVAYTAIWSRGGFRSMWD